MKNDIFYSVIIPLYNKEKSIRNTIESVLSQTFPCYELIIVNDGSTDNSLQIIQSIKDKRIKITTKENEGVSSARNVGIRMAKGKYIAFLDADDIWVPEYLDKMNKLIEDFKEASFFSCQFYIDNGADVTIRNAIHNKRGYVEDFFKAYYSAPVVWSSSVIVNIECFNEVGFFNSKYTRGEDLDMWFRLAKKFKLAFEPKPLSIYITNSENSACGFSHPLKNRFLNFNLFKMSKYERKINLRNILNVIIEILKLRRRS